MYTFVVSVAIHITTNGIVTLTVKTGNLSQFEHIVLSNYYFSFMRPIYFQGQEVCEEELIKDVLPSKSHQSPLYLSDSEVDHDDRKLTHGSSEFVTDSDVSPNSCGGFISTLFLSYNGKCEKVKQSPPNMPIEKDEPVKHNSLETFDKLDSENNHTAVNYVEHISHSMYTEVCPENGAHPKHCDDCSGGSLECSFCKESCSDIFYQYCETCMICYGVFIPWGCKIDLEFVGDKCFVWDIKIQKHLHHGKLHIVSQGLKYITKGSKSEVTESCQIKPNIVESTFETTNSTGIIMELGDTSSGSRTLDEANETLTPSSPNFVTMLAAGNADSNIKSETRSEDYDNCYKMHKFVNNKTSIYDQNEKEKEYLLGGVFGEKSESNLIKDASSSFNSNVVTSDSETEKKIYSNIMESIFSSSSLDNTASEKCITNSPSISSESDAPTSYSVNTATSSDFLDTSKKNNSVVLDDLAKSKFTKNTAYSNSVDSTTSEDATILVHSNSRNQTSNSAAVDYAACSEVIDNSSKVKNYILGSLPNSSTVSGISSVDTPLSEVESMTSLPNKQDVNNDSDTSYPVTFEVYADQDIGGSLSKECVVKLYYKECQGVKDSCDGEERVETTENRQEVSVYLSQHNPESRSNLPEKTLDSRENKQEVTYNVKETPGSDNKTFEREGLELLANSQGISLDCREGSEQKQQNVGMESIEVTLYCQENQSLNQNLQSGKLQAPSDQQAIDVYCTKVQEPECQTTEIKSIDVVENRQQTYSCDEEIKKPEYKNIDIQSLDVLRKGKEDGKSFDIYHRYQESHLVGESSLVPESKKTLADMFTDISSDPYLGKRKRTLTEKAKERASDHKKIEKISGKKLKMEKHSLLVKYEEADKLQKEAVHISRYICEYCGKKFNSAGGFRYHVDSHEIGKAKVYSCSLCIYTTRRQADLRKHNVIHTGEKKYKCEVCGQEFSVNSSYKRHLRIHSGQKPYKCSVCSKDFSSNGTLKQHMVKHTDIRNIICEVCGISFRLQHHYTAHQKLHSGEMPFKCVYCGVAFRSHSSLRHHRKKTHPKEEANRMKQLKLRKAVVNDYSAHSSQLGVRGSLDVLEQAMAAAVDPVTYDCVDSGTQTEATVNGEVVPLVADVMTEKHADRDSVVLAITHLEEDVSNETVVSSNQSGTHNDIPLTDLSDPSTTVLSVAKPVKQNNLDQDIKDFSGSFCTSDAINLPQEFMMVKSSEDSVPIVKSENIEEFGDHGSRTSQMYIMLSDGQTQQPHLYFVVEEEAQTSSTTT